MFTWDEPQKSSRGNIHICHLTLLWNFEKILRRICTKTTWGINKRFFKIVIKKTPHHIDCLYTKIWKSVVQFYRIILPGWYLVIWCNGSWNGWCRAAIFQWDAIISYEEDKRSRRTTSQRYWKSNVYVKSYVSLKCTRSKFVYAR